MSTLWLVPTPIDPESRLSVEAHALLLSASENPERSCVIVEELKEARRRWLDWGLPRDPISRFRVLNEHSKPEEHGEILALLKSGQDVYLMSDAGLPAFCDPGQGLVDLCHRAKIRVRSAPISNSVVLAIALSGFPSERFVFEGFLPRAQETRSQAIQRALVDPRMVVFMDTPYRFTSLVHEVAAAAKTLRQGARWACLAAELNSTAERVLRAPLSMIEADTHAAIQKAELPKKAEFVLVIAPKDYA